MSPRPVEPFDCARIDARLEPYLQDQVPPHERRGMRRHIQACPVCFDKVVARDPVQLFAPLADEEFGDLGGSGARGSAFWSRFWPGIEAAIQRPPALRGARRSGPAARYVRGALAAAVLVAAGLTIARLVPPSPPAAPAPGVVRPQVAGVAPAAPPSRPAPLPQTVERVRGARADEVQIYSMKYVQEPPVGRPADGEAQVTELVLIVDAGLEL